EASTQEYVLSPDLNRDRFLQEINIQKDDLKTTLKKYTDFVNKYFPDETDLNESIRKNANLYVQNSDRMVQLRQNSTLSVQPMRNITMEQDFQASEDALFQSVDNAISHEIDEMADRSNAVDTAIKNSSLVTLSSTVISVIIAIVFGLYFSRYISRPISDLRQASIQIGKGDYVTACKFLSKTHRADEIGKLSYEIEKMRQSIESMKTNLDKLVGQRTEELEMKNHQLLETEKDLRLVNEELVKTELAKEEFMSMVSHELKTPLSPMKLYSQMLLKSSKSFGKLNERQNKAVTVILDSIMILEVVISDILDVYKLDIGRLRINKIDIDVEKLVDQIVTEFKPLADDNKIEPRSDVPSTIKCDPQRISQVLSNLVKNSLDFVPKETGRITIQAREDSNDGFRKVIFTVEDNGSGIPADKIGSLFKKFYQVDTTLTRKHGGTGLGPAISKGIIEAHGGTMWIDKNYNNGACFRFILPRNDETI
ncbi:MAG: HAMP domain-containing sensor histidine kinase, partial [Nitrososphaeraceae archaeon]